MKPAIDIINGCVLFPHAADWRQPPQHKRSWETEIAEGIHGQESRAALRAQARRAITFLITAELTERVRLEARLDAALQSANQNAPLGFACAPLHGRSSILTNAAPAGTHAGILLNTPAGWNWQIGDYAILIADDVTYDVAAVINVGLTADQTTWTADSAMPVNQSALTLAVPLNYSWNAGTLVWPLIFGKLTASGPSGKETALTGDTGAMQILISEIVSSRSAAVGNLPAAGPGVGEQVIGQSNVVG